MSYEYETIADIIRLSEENNISFGDVVMRSELEQYDRSEKEINPICLVEMRLV